MNIITVAGHTEICGGLQVAATYSRAHPGLQICGFQDLDAGDVIQETDIIFPHSDFGERMVVRRTDFPET